MNNFKLTVYVQRRPHLRDEKLEYSLYLGYGVLKQIFDDEIVDPTVKNVTFFYPERWLNIVEERSLYQRLEHFCPNLETVTIVTQSVYIIQCTRKEDIQIISSEDEIEQIEKKWWFNTRTNYLTILV